MLSRKVDECKPLPVSTATGGSVPVVRGLHSSIFQLNVNAFCGTRGVQGVFKGYVWRWWRGLFDVEGMF
jgi:hypothetical protein